MFEFFCIPLLKTKSYSKNAYSFVFQPKKAYNHDQLPQKADQSDGYS